MPKRSNPKKMAAQQFGKMRSLASAANDGKYLVAKVEKPLGNCQFYAQLDIGGRRLQQVTVLVRGKFKGGKNCITRVEPGCYVLVEGGAEKTMEVVGVVNQQAEVERLRSSGRLTDTLRNYTVDGAAGGGGDDLDDIFDRSGEGSAAQMAGDAWGKRDEEREAMAEELVARYQQKAAGRAGKTRLESCLRGGGAAAGGEGLDLFSEADAVAEETSHAAAYLGLLEAEPGKRPVTSQRRLRAAALAEAEAARVAAAEAAAQAAYWAEQRRLAALEEDGGAAAAVPERWDADEVDIDAI